jgi:hypothetical protein
MRGQVHFFENFAEYFLNGFKVKEAELPGSCGEYVHSRVECIQKIREAKWFEIFGTNAPALVDFCSPNVKIQASKPAEIQLQELLQRFTMYGCFTLRQLARMCYITSTSTSTSQSVFIYIFSMDPCPNRLSVTKDRRKITKCYAITKVHVDCTCLL